jgi:hypothetical protein
MMFVQRRVYCLCRDGAALLQKTQRFSCELQQFGLSFLSVCFFSGQQFKLTLYSLILKKVCFHYTGSSFRPHRQFTFAEQFILSRVKISLFCPPWCVLLCYLEAYF